MRRFSVLSGELTRGFLVRRHLLSPPHEQDHMPAVRFPTGKLYHLQEAVRFFSSISLESTPAAASSGASPESILGGKVQELEKEYKAALDFYRKKDDAVTNLETELKNAKEEEKGELEKRLVEARNDKERAGTAFDTARALLDSALKDKESARADNAPKILPDKFVETLQQMGYLREDRSVMQALSYDSFDVPLRNRQEPLKAMFSILESRYGDIKINGMTNKTFAYHGVIPAAAGMGKSRMLQVIGTALPSLGEDVINQLLDHTSDHQKMIDAMDLSHNQRAKLEGLVAYCKGTSDPSFFKHMASCIGVSVTFNHTTTIEEQEKQCSEQEIIIHRLLWSHFCKPTVDFCRFVAALQLPPSFNLESALNLIRSDFQDSDTRHIVVVIDEVMLSERDPAKMLSSTSHYMDNVPWAHFAWSSLSYEALDKTSTDREIRSVYLSRLSDKDATVVPVPAIASMRVIQV